MVISKLKDLKFGKTDILFLLLFIFVLELKFVRFFNIFYFVLLLFAWFLTYMILDRFKLINEKNAKIGLKIVLLALLIIFLFSIFKGGLLDEGPPTFSDFPDHYFNEYLLTTKIIPTFQNIIGWEYAYAAGTVQTSKQPPFQTLFIFALNSILPLSFSLIFRLVFVFSFLLSVLGVYLFSKKISSSTDIGILTSILWLSSNHNHLLGGGNAAYFGIGFALIATCFYIDYSEGKKKAIYPLTFFLVLLFNSNPFIFLSCILSIILIYFVINKDYKKIKIKELIIPIILFFSAIALYFSDVLVVDETFSSEARFKIFSVWYNFTAQFMSIIPYVPIIFLLSFYSLLFFRENKKYVLLEVGFISFILFNIFFWYLLVEPGIVPAAIGASKPILFIEVISVILSGYVISKIFYSFKDKDTFTKITLIIFISLISYDIIGGSFFFNGIIQSPSTYWDGYYSWSFKGVYKIDLNKGLLSSQLKNETKDIIEKISELNTTSRILFEDDWTEFNIGGGYQATQLFYTNKSFVDVWYPLFLKGINLQIENTYIFGEPVSNLSEEFFEKNLKLFNAKYLIAWSAPFKGFLENNSNFKKVYSNGFFDIYDYLNAYNSYIIGADGNVTFNSKEIIVEISNATKDKEIMISSRYFSRWHAYLDNKEIGIYPVEDTFIGFKSPKTGNYVISIIYEEGLYEALSKYLTIISFLILILINLIYLFYFRKEKLT
jgi:hypothetical protein